ncbi:NucA/NucB deoxyribonuclease domain-containing protein [Streptomyces sp. NBC_00057]
MPRPTGKSCDEYPFASTKEGGAAGVGGARLSLKRSPCW